MEIPTVAIVKFEGDKLAHEHIYWDQASVLVQVGLLDARGLPVAGAETAHKVVDKSLPSNRLMNAGNESEGKRVYLSYALGERSLIAWRGAWPPQVLGRVLSHHQQGQRKRKQIRSSHSALSTRIGSIEATLRAGR